MLKTLLRRLQIKPTPNPLCKKFVHDKKILSEGTHDISDIKYATSSPLALKLFSIPGVTRIFYSPDFISLTKSETSNWEEIEPVASKGISEYLEGGLPLFTASLQTESYYNLENEVEAIIQEIIEGRIRPHLQEDGGDIKFLGFNEKTGIVSFEMQGSCAGCPSSFATLKDGIEKMLMFYIPEVKGVQSIN